MCLEFFIVSRIYVYYFVNTIQNENVFHIYAKSVPTKS